MEILRDLRRPIPLGQSILTRFTLAMSLVVVLSTVGTGLIVFQFANAEMREGIRQRNGQVALRAAGEIGSFLRTARRDLRQIGLLLPMEGRDGLSASAFLENRDIGMPYIHRIAMVDREGRIIADNSPRSLSLTDFGLPAADAVRLGSTGRWTTRLSRHGLPRSTIVEPAAWGGAKDVFLIAEVDLRRVRDIVDEVQIGEHGFAYLATEEGLLIAHPDKKLVLRNAGALTPKMPFFRVVARIPETGWIVTIAQSDKEAFLPIRTVLSQSLLLIVFFTAVSFLIGGLYVLRTSRPVRSLLEATDALGAGDMDFRIKPVAKNEFGIIARSFNEMAGSLKARTEDLEDSQARLRLITESVTDVIFSLDSGGCFTFVTSRIQTVTGFAPADLIGRFFGELLAPGDANLPVFDFLRSPFRGHQESITAQPFLLAFDGKKIGFETEIVKLVEPDGTMRFHGVGRDITERRRMEERMRRTERLSLLGELVAGMAHELRNSMNGILGFSQSLRTSPHLVGREIHDIDGLRREADHAQKLMQGLLSFSRVSDPMPGPCAWNGVLEEALDVCSYDLENAGIAVRRILDAQIPMLWADAAQLQGVFVNLIRNAVQAIRSTGRAGTILVETRCMESRAYAIIADSGPGIPPADLAKVFDPFYTTKTSGSGLGLSVSLRMMHAHGGDIRVENRDGWGACFTVELPLSGAAGADTPMGMPSDGVSTAGSNEAPIPAGCRILLAEDEDSIREYVGRFLRSRGCEVRTVGNGLETVDALGENARFDLILSDLRMPHMDGEELYSWILAHKPALLKRVIFLTGDLSNPRSRGFLSSTGVAYLEKPIVASRLARVIADAMRQSGPVRD